MTDRSAPIIPASYEDWKHCITVLCGIPLTRSYVEARIAALGDPRNYATQRFAEVWGQAQLDRVRGWFADARVELGGSTT